MRFTARAFKRRLSRRLSRRLKQRRQRTRKYRSRKQQRGGSTIPNTNPSLQNLRDQGAVFANPVEVEEYEPFKVTYTRSEEKA